MTTVGYGDLSPSTGAGRAVAVVLMVAGIGSVSMLTALVASALIERRLRHNRGMETYELEQHIVISEWNPRAREILREIRSDRRAATAAVVLIADLPEKPVADPHLYFVRGTVDEETLRRAGVAGAATVVILGDDGLDIVARDARAVLAALTVESINREVYTIVELVDAANVQFCERANVDEVIVASEFNSMLLSRAALDHGVSKVVSDLLSTRRGHNLAKIPTPDTLVGAHFFDAFCQLKQAQNSIVLGVQQAAGGKVISNPPADYEIHAGDMLIVVME
ncbi:MAG: cag pathogenicity island protein Cag26 [Gemmatimonas sp.]|nr:cag pathogenicity island protein Cag26 [Gemmatimonas sp.]